MTVCPVIQMVLAGVMFVRLVTYLTTRPTTAGVSFLFTFVISTHVMQYSYQNFFELYPQNFLCALNLTKHGYRFCIACCTFG